MARLGVLCTPAVVIDGEIVAMGRVPSLADPKDLIGARVGRSPRTVVS
jgi:predicted thioredoxin/glutaredoxin